MPDVDDDFLDGCDLSGLPLDRHVRDEHIPWLVLFADIDRRNPRATTERAWQWKELFSGT